jgi:hypothetical protein
MISSGECRAKAEECVRLACEAQPREIRVALSNMERTWVMLADQRDRLEALRELTTA